MDSKIVLYSYRRCPFAIRVRMVLNEKNLAFEKIEEDLKNFSDDLLRLHPEAKVPVLIDRGFAIYESAVITEYLEEQFPKIRLMPKDIQDRTRVRQWTYWSNHIAKPDIQKFKFEANHLSKGELEKVQEQLKKHYQQIEDQLKQSSWLVGNEYSLADIHVFPFFRQLSTCKPPPAHLELFPKTKEWLERIISRPAFAKTMEK
jgi:glutathione S-transferase